MATPKTILFRYARLLLLVVSFFIITIVGEGVAPVGLILLYGGFTDSTINLVAGLGLGIAALSPFFLSKSHYPIVATLAALMLFISVQMILSLYAKSAGVGGVVHGSVSFFTLVLSYS
jgi:hypothetical protein